MMHLFLVFALLMQGNLTARTGVVTGIVRTERGQPISKVRVAVSPAGGELAAVLMESLALTDAEGRFRLENVTPGSYHVIVGRGALAQYHPGVADAAKATIVEVTAGKTITVADIVQARTAVSGQVVDLATGGGRKIESLTICCEEKGQYEAASASGIAEYAAAVGADGTFTFAAIPPGQYTIHANDPQIKSIAQSISVGDEDIRGLRIAVSPPVVVDGTIVDGNGQPVAVTARLRRHPDNTTVESLRPPAGIAQVTISFSLPFAPGAPGSVLVQTGTSLLSRQPPPFKTLSVGADGRFTFVNVLPGKYVLEIGAIAATLLEETVDVDAGGLRDLRIQLPVVPVRGRVIASSGAPLPTLTGSVRVAKTNAPDDIQYAFPDQTGRFALLLGAGDYRIFPQSLGRSVVSVSVGSKDIPDDVFSFNGVSSEEITITIEP